MDKALVVAALFVPLAAHAQWRVTSDQTVGGFAFPESVACDAKGKALYVSNFGSKLAPAEKDAAGYISKLGLDGKVIEKNFLPGAKGEKLNKPKGIWVKGNRLWTTDIDVVWVFDLKTKQGRKVTLPGAQFANDPAVMGNTLYVSDNRTDQVFKVEPADFLNVKKEPSVASVFQGQHVNPNGLWPSKTGMLYMVGFVAPDQPRAIYALGVSGQVKKVSDPIGRLDGIYELQDGSLLVTDWNSGSLFHWSESTGMKPLASGFKGPADFCVMPQSGGLTVVVPDLVQSQLRFVQLRK
jgi:hypothetical protein